MSILGSEKLRTDIQKKSSMKLPTKKQGKDWDDDQKAMASEADCIRVQDYASYGIQMYEDFPEDTKGTGRDALATGHPKIHRDLGSDPSKYTMVDLRPVIGLAVVEAKGNFRDGKDWELGYDGTEEEIRKETQAKYKAKMPKVGGKSHYYQTHDSTVVGRTVLFLIRLLATVIP
jgi:hypothetical protein